MPGTPTRKISLRVNSTPKNQAPEVRSFHPEHKQADFDRGNKSLAQKDPKIDIPPRKNNAEGEKKPPVVYGRGGESHNYAPKADSKPAKSEHSDYDYNRPPKQPLDKPNDSKAYAEKTSYRAKDKPEGKKDYPQKQGAGYGRNAGDPDYVKVDARESEYKKPDRRENDYSYKSDQEYKQKNQPKDIEDDYDYKKTSKGSRYDNDEFEQRDRYGKRDHTRKDFDKNEEQARNKPKSKQTPVVYYQRVDQSDDNSTASFQSSQHNSTASESRYDYDYSSTNERSGNHGGGRDNRGGNKSGNYQGQDSWKANRNERDFDGNEYDDGYKRKDHGRAAESKKNKDTGFKERPFEKEAEEKKPPKEDFKKKEPSTKQAKKTEEPEKPAFKPSSDQFAKKQEQKAPHHKYEDDFNNEFGEYEDQEYYEEYDDYEPVYEKETASEPSNDEVIALMVAEKPSIALSVARALSDGRFTQRKGRSPICPVYQFRGSFMNHKKVLFKVTSVAGHVYSRDFPKQYADWVRTDPIDLFQAETVLVESNPKNRIVDHLKNEAKNASFLMLWLDNDREGENICFEIMGAVTSMMKKEVFKQVFRAIFSSLATPDLKESFRKISKGPNRNESISVDARQIIDLKIGVVFSRFQSLYFGEKYSKLSGNKVGFGHPDHFRALSDPSARLLRPKTHREREFQARKVLHSARSHKDQQPRTPNRVHRGEAAQKGRSRQTKEGNRAVHDRCR